MQMTNQSSMHFAHYARRPHSCMWSCLHVHSRTPAVRSPLRDRQPTRLHRAISVPLSSRYCTGSLSTLASDRNEWDNSCCCCCCCRRRVPRELELPTLDVSRRRPTSTSAPTLRSLDMAKPSSKLARARHVLRAPTTERSSARKPTNAKMDVQRSRRETPGSLKMVHRNATPSQSGDGTRNKPIVKASDKSTQARLLTADLQLKVSKPLRTKRERRSAAAAGRATRSLAPVAMDVKLPSVECELKRTDGLRPRTKKPICHPKTTTIADSKSFCASQKDSAHQSENRLSGMDLRSQSRRHTTTEVLVRNTKPLRHGNLEPVVEEVDRRNARFRPKRMTEPIDFHLSRFNLTSERCPTKAKSVSDTVKSGRHDSGRKAKKKTGLEPAKRSTPKLCDLAYLEKFRSHTL